MVVTILDHYRGSIQYDGSLQAIPASALYRIRDIVAERRVGKHDIYWGCHACDKESGHSRECECSCGAKPARYSILWGDDFKGYTPVELNRKKQLMNGFESRGMSIVDYKLEDTIVNGMYRQYKRGKLKRAQRRRNTRTGG